MVRIVTVQYSSKTAFTMRDNLHHPQTPIQHGVSGAVGDNHNIEYRISPEWRRVNPRSLIPPPDHLQICLPYIPQQKFQKCHPIRSHWSIFKRC
eukprot:15214193-Ditylum_brightwellii.AAC.1